MWTDSDPFSPFPFLPPAALLSLPGSFLRVLALFPVSTPTLKLSLLSTIPEWSSYSLTQIVSLPWSNPPQITKSQTPRSGLGHLQVLPFPMNTLPAAHPSFSSAPATLTPCSLSPLGLCTCYSSYFDMFPQVTPGFWFFRCLLQCHLSVRTSLFPLCKNHTLSSSPLPWPSLSCFLVYFPLHLPPSHNCMWSLFLFLSVSLHPHFRMKVPRRQGFKRH